MLCLQVKDGGDDLQQFEVNLNRHCVRHETNGSGDTALSSLKPRQSAPHYGLLPPHEEPPVFME